MQTSFMHPPFGFALMYLRSVAPKAVYADKMTGRQMAPVTSGQIYWGAVPFVGIQLVMVALLILMPSLTMGAKTILPGVVPGFGAAVPVAGGTGGLSLPGVPPPLEGARALPAGTPQGPSLDFSVPPKL